MSQAPLEPLEPSDPAPTGESADVERLFREHNATLLRFIAAKVGSEQEAREIAQEAYVQVLRLNHPEAVSYLRAFLFKTAANLAVDRIRQRGRRMRFAAPAEHIKFGVFELSPERQVASEQALTVLRAAVDELPPKCRQAFLLHRVHELSSEEIAQRMRLQDRMVRRYVARALDHIRARLDEAQINPGSEAL